MWQPMPPLPGNSGQADISAEESESHRSEHLIESMLAPGSGCRGGRGPCRAVVDPRDSESLTASHWKLYRLHILRC
jgi:hypothetical protein